MSEDFKEFVMVLIITHVRWADMSFIYSIRTSLYYVEHTVLLIGNPICYIANSENKLYFHPSLHLSFFLTAYPIQG